MAAERDSTAALPRGGRVWPLPLRVLFRFSFLYWLLYIVPSAGAVSLFSLIPFGGLGDTVGAWLAWPLGRMAHVVGVHVFHLQGEAADWHLTGAGDTAMQYVLMLVIAVLAVAGTIAWSAVDERRRGRRAYRTAYAWLRLALRFTLAITLLGYGFAKIFPGQFGPGPTLAHLNETYGQSSPMHLLWTFMSFSRPYAVFGGLMETIPGVLLLFERTETIGALGAAAVMLNVAVLNFCYDVPVKLYSTHLFLMSVFLLLPEMRALWEFFVCRRPAQLAAVRTPRPEMRALRIGRRVAFGVVCLLCLWVNVAGWVFGRPSPAPRAPLYGVWTVDGVAGWKDGDPPTQVIFDTVQLAFGTIQYAQVTTASGKQHRYRLQWDAQHKDVQFLQMDARTELQWSQPSSDAITLTGTWRGLPVTLSMHPAKGYPYLLTSRGFHWVQEEPFNQ